MIYRSNLRAPDLQPQFKHTVCRVMPHSQGHDVLSDWADKPEDGGFWSQQKQCGFWTHDEAAILYNVALAIPGVWIDIGGHTGWTAAHLMAADCRVITVDPEFSRPEFTSRVRDNFATGKLLFADSTSSEYFPRVCTGIVNGFVIDGNHDAPHPLQDAAQAWRLVADGGVILCHDARGGPIKDAYRWLAQMHGWKIKLYHTPHGVALGYRDPFVPPEHIHDPNVSEVTF